MHEIKRKIIIALRYKQGCSFSDLNVDGVDSNKLAYHIKDLEKQGLIFNEDSKYHLTAEGKRELNFLCDQTAQIRKHPVPVVLCLPVDGDKILLQERTKEPWFGYWMFSAGKVEFGENFDEAAKRELFEETGLTGDTKYVGLVNSRTFNDGALSYHVHLHCYKVHNISGDLKQEVKEGRNKWFDHSEVSSIKINPIDKVIFDKLHESGWMLDLDMHFEGEQLVDTNVKHIVL